MDTTAPVAGYGRDPHLQEAFSCLNSKDWKRDKGFEQAIKANPGTRMFHDQVLGPGRADAVAYWRKEKSERPLWQLLLVDVGAHQMPQTLGHFGLPADTDKFLRWVSDHVAHAEPEKVKGMGKGFFGAGFTQMSYFPYDVLYEVWQSEDDAARAARVPKGNVAVYLDRVTEPTGEVLHRW